MHFLLTALSIVLIDLLLAGDNALVIALAVRSLPKRERRMGIIGGAAPAVPEPGTIGLALGGLVAMAVYLRRTQLSARS